MEVKTLAMEIARMLDGADFSGPPKKKFDHTEPRAAFEGETRSIAQGRTRDSPAAQRAGGGTPPVQGRGTPHLPEQMRPPPATPARGGGHPREEWVEEEAGWEEEESSGEDEVRARGRGGGRRSDQGGRGAWSGDAASPPRSLNLISRNLCIDQF